MLHDHAELAAQEQAQREAIQVRCGGRLTLPGSITLHAASTERFFLGPARRLDSLSLSSNATGFDQDDTAGLAAERAIDYYLLENSILFETAACKCTLQIQPSARPFYSCACRPHSTCSSGRACGMPSSRLLCLPLSGTASLPAAPERQLSPCLL